MSLVRFWIIKENKLVGYKLLFNRAIRKQYSPSNGILNERINPSFFEAANKICFAKIVEDLIEVLDRY